MLKELLLESSDNNFWGEGKWLNYLVPTVYEV